MVEGVKGVLQTQTNKPEKNDSVDIKPMLEELEQSGVITRERLCTLADKLISEGKFEEARLVKMLACREGHVKTRENNLPKVKVIKDLFVRANLNSDKGLDSYEVEQLDKNKDGKITIEDLKELGDEPLVDIRELLLDMIRKSPDKVIGKLGLFKKAMELKEKPGSDKYDGAYNRKVGLLRNLANSNAFETVKLPETCGMKIPPGGGLGEAQIYDICVGDGNLETLNILDVEYFDGYFAKK